MLMMLLLLLQLQGACGRLGAQPPHLSAEDPVVDGRRGLTTPEPLPVSYYPSGFTLTHGNLVGVVALPSAYVVSFDVFPTSDADNDWQSLLSLGTTNSNNVECELPRLEMWPSTGGVKPRNLMVGFMIRSVSDSNFNDGNEPAFSLALSAWSTVTITVDYVSSVQTLTISGATTLATLTKASVTTSQTAFPSVNVWASTAGGMAAFPAVIRNLAIAEPGSPSPEPSLQPSLQPSFQPSFQPSLQPSPPPSPQPSRPTRAPRAAPVPRPTLTPTLGARAQHYWFKTWHRGADCASTPDVIDLFLGSLGKCAAGASVGSAPHIDSCRVGEHKYSITRTSFAPTDPFCLGAPIALGPRVVLEHDWACAKDNKGGVSGDRDGLDYVKTHCAVPIEALLLPNPDALYVALNSFIGAGCTGASFTRLRILGVCRPWAEPGAGQGVHLGHRKITVADTLGALHLLIQHYSHTDTLCQHPLRVETVAYSQPGGAAGECHPDPLNPGMSYSAAQLGPVNLFALTDTAPLPPTALPTRAPTMPSAAPTRAPTAPTATPTSAPPPALTDWLLRLSTAGTGASQTVIAAHYKFLTALSSAGQMSKIVRLNTFAGNDVTAALIPLVKGGGGSSEVVYTSSGALSSGWDGTYTELGGLTSSNSGGKFLSTGQLISHANLMDATSAASDGSNLALGMYFLNTPTSACRFMGVYRQNVPTRHYLLVDNFGTNCFDWGSQLCSAQSLTSGLAFVSGSSSGVSQYMCAKGASTCPSTSYTAGDKSQPADWAVGIFAAAGSATGVSTESLAPFSVCGNGAARLAGYIIGYSMSSADVTALNNAWRELNVDLGR